MFENENIEAKYCKQQNEKIKIKQLTLNFNQFYTSFFIIHLKNDHKFITDLLVIYQFQAMSKT